MMLITKTSRMTGEEHTREIAVTDSEITDWETSGKLIQEAFPNLSADDREFILTGVTPEEWAYAMAEVENGISNLDTDEY